MSTQTQLSESNKQYFEKYLKPDSYVSFKMNNGTFLKGKVLSVDFEKGKVVLNNSMKNNPEDSKIVDISDKLRVMTPGQKHDLRELTNINSLKNDYGISFDQYKDDLRNLCSHNSSMSKMLVSEKLTPNEQGIKEIKNYTVRLKVVEDPETKLKRLKQIVGYSRESFMEKYNGDQIGIKFTDEMKHDLVKNGHIGVMDVATKFDDELKPKFIGFDPELNRVIPISVEKITKDLENNFSPSQIEDLLSGNTAYTKNGKEVKIDTVSYITKGNIVKATGQTVKQIETQAVQVNKQEKNIEKNDTSQNQEKKKSRGIKM